MDSLHTVANYINLNANPLHMNGRSFENNCNVYIYTRVILVFSVGIQSVRWRVNWQKVPACVHNAYLWLSHRIDVLAVVGILVLDLRNFQLQTSNYTFRICSYSVMIDSLRD